MAEHKYTLEGFDAVAANILAEVYEIFSKESAKDRDNMYEEWRLEYYIMEIMCSPMSSSWEFTRSKIGAAVELFFPGYGPEKQPKARYDRAFRRLTRRGFLYGSYTHDYRYGTKERSYGLKLGRYEKEAA